MNSAWHSLLWKEWREHRWKLAALAAIFVLVPVVSSLRHPDNIFGAVSIVFFTALPLGSMFVAMNIAAGEQSRGTIKFLQSLPVPMTRPAGAKLLCGVLTAVTPVLLAVAVAWLWSWLMNPGNVADSIAYDRSVYQTSWLIDNWYVARAAGGSLAAISILIWMAAAGVNRSDEIRAAAIGLLAIVGCWAMLMVLLIVVRPTDGMPYWWHVLTAGAAGGPSLSQPGVVAEATARTAGPVLALWPFAAVALCSHLGLASWFIARFGRKLPGSKSPLPMPLVVMEKAWLAPPWRRPSTAIFWKQFRESAPLAAAVAVAIFMTAVIIAGYAWWRGGGDAPEALVATSYGAWAIGGLFVAIAAGIAVFVEDLEPRLHAFWRSRPVSVDQWFVVKFLTGLLIPLLILPLPALVAVAFALIMGAELPPDAGEAAQMAAYYLLVQVGVYSTAVLAITLVRQAAYAAILTIAAVGLFLASLEFISPGMSGPAAAAAGGCATVVVAVLAWLALRNDWGWQGS